VYFVVKIHPRLENLFEILHEDADLLVVNKPAGLVCHPTKGDAYSSLISRARLYLNFSLSANKAGGEGRGEVDFSFQPSAISLRPCLINRLDRETSGVVILAKNAAAAGALGKLWETRAVQKEYLAIVHGRVRDDHGLIDAPLGRDDHSRVAVKDCVRPDGAPARTVYRVEQRFNRSSPRPSSSDSEDRERERGRGGERGRIDPSTLNPQLSTDAYSLLRVIPHTGRKHQIRIHLAHLGHPIVGDKLYGGDEDLYLALVEDRLTPEQRARLILSNHALHARAVRFAWRGRPVEFSCAPGAEFAEFIRNPGPRGARAE
jgi:23S rRNA pseudouridine1911/1915/1917 synthase